MYNKNMYIIKYIVGIIILNKLSVYSITVRKIHFVILPPLIPSLMHFFTLYFQVSDLHYFPSL